MTTNFQIYSSTIEYGNVTRPEDVLQKQNISPFFDYTLYMGGGL